MASSRTLNIPLACPPSPCSSFFTFSFSPCLDCGHVVAAQRVRRPPLPPKWVSMQTPLLETWCSVRNSCRVSGGAVGAKGRQVILATDRHPETNIKRSQIAFAVTSIENPGARLLGLHTQSLMRVPNAAVSLSLSLFFSLSHAHSHTCADTHTHTCTHTHTHTQIHTHAMTPALLNALAVTL